MYLHKTDLARNALASRARTLSPRERAVLLMADGKRSRRELLSLLQCDQAMIDSLVTAGYLRVAAHAQGGAVPVGAPVAPAELAWAAEASPRPAAPTPHSTDNFEGKRSLATTRMFLFDLCERLFARRHPEWAQTFRDALREARDRESMLAVSRRILAAVEEVAGAERADTLSERIAMLLPPDNG